MKENSIYDKKSIRAVIGKTSDFGELAKDCVAFSNAEGGCIDIGIEDYEKLPPEGQKIPEGLATLIVNKIGERTHGVVLSAEVHTADNGGEFVKLHIPRNPNTAAATTSGKFYIRIGDNSLPVGPEDLPRLSEDKGSLSWEDNETKFSWKDADGDKLNELIRQLKLSDRVSEFVKQKDIKEILDFYYLTEPDSDNMTNLGVLFIGKQTQRGRIPNSPVVQCIKYDQYGEKVNKWLCDDFTRNPFEIIRFIWENVPEWRESTEVSDGLFRRNVPAYPVSVRVERRVINQEVIKVMQLAEQNYDVKQKQLICLGLIAVKESVTASHLISVLNLKDADALRSWLRPLIEKGLVVSTDDHSKAKEYRINPEILKNSNYMGKTSLKRIENYRLKELILEDLKIYRVATAKEINVRIGEEIDSYKLWKQLQSLIEEGKIRKVGQNRWLKYEIAE